MDLLHVGFFDLLDGFLLVTVVDFLGDTSACILIARILLLKFLLLLFEQLLQVLFLGGCTLLEPEHLQDIFVPLVQLGHVSDFIFELGGSSGVR